MAKPFQAEKKAWVPAVPMVLPDCCQRVGAAAVSLNANHAAQVDWQRRAHVDDELVAYIREGRRGLERWLPSGAGAARQGRKAVGTS